MTDTQNLVSGFTPEQLRLMLKEATAAQSAVQDAINSRLSAAGEEFLTLLVTDTQVETSNTSAWVGHSVKGLTLNVDGVAYTVAVTITETARTAARRPIVEQAKAVAKVNKLDADGTKAIVKAALDLHENPEPATADA